VTIAELLFLEVRKLNVRYRTSGGMVWAVRDLSFRLAQGETTALVGETASGKSSVALSLLGLRQPEAQVDAEAILFEGQELSRLNDTEWRKLRGSRIALVFQDSRGALNPVLTVGHHLIESIRAHRRISRSGARQAAIQLLAEVGMPEPESQLGRYSFEMSGGMCQRLGIAIGIANQPRLLIADEPTSALDPTIQAQILELLREMKHRYGLTLLIVSHDLALVSEFADRIMVMYSGRLVESGLRDEVFSRPAHPYTRALIRCQPGLHHHPDTHPLAEIPGSVPAPGRDTPGCVFYSRCSLADNGCAASQPQARNLSGTHSAACFKSGVEVESTTGH
jgi:oligopeptide/dipeptide ABC transporter ATP-binding protein